MDTSDGQAAARLRAALWRAEKVAPGWIAKRGQLVELSADVDVDLDRAMALGLQLTAEPSEPVDVGADIEPLTYDLLPYWEEDWLLFERERVRQLRVHALESLCRQLVECGQLAQAIDAGLAAVASEPLRESAHRALIAAHLAEGNVSEARRQYQLYRAVLDDQLGLTPSPLLRELVFGASAKPA
jgi:DNA-binding SARP family transcriptional activator